MATAIDLARRAQNAWHPPADLLAAAQAATWRGDPQPVVSEQQPIGPGVVALGRYVRARWPELVYQTYARGRDMASGASPSMHHAGRAIDLMIHEVDGGPDRRGDAIADWLLANAREIGVQYFIWSGTQWSSATGRTSVYPGAESHDNHIHVDLTEAGAAGTTPWFRGGSMSAVALAIGAAAGVWWWVSRRR